MPITGTVLQVARTHPERPAIVGPSDAITYADLVRTSPATFAVVDAAHSSHRDGYAVNAAQRPTPADETGGIPITALSVTSAFHTARILASLAGFRAVSATIDPRWPLAHRVGVILRCGIGLVISDAADLGPALAEAGWTGTLLPLAEFLRREQAVLASTADDPPPAPTVRAGDEAFLLLFSSGTTSDPKAFVKTRAQYRENFAVSRAHLEPDPGVATLAPGPVSYSLTLYAVVESLASGGSVHVADAFDAAGLGRRIRDEHITRVVAVPAVVQALTDAARRHPDAFTDLRLVVTGGANLPSSIRERLTATLPGVRLISYYGAAEIGFIGDSRGGDGTLLDIYDGIGVDIRDESGMSVAAGDLGTVWIHAAACSDGYVGATTAEVLRGADGWATVHDQGRLIDGRLALVGRAGDIAITGGHKVALTEVERAFDGMPLPGAVCAVALPHPRLGTVVALVAETGSSTPRDKAADSAGLDKAALQRRARTQLAPQFVPRRWYALDRLPRTVGGKIRRAQTRNLVLSGQAVRL